MAENGPTTDGVRLHDWFHRHVEERVEAVVGGRARLRVVILLAGVLGLSTADTATVGAIAGELVPALHIGNVDIGLLVTASTAIGAVATLPMGILADRFNRVRLLWITILIWCAAMVASGSATSFTMLLLTRLALGAVVATAGPVIASLTGDLFPPAERGRIYGYILTGELVGTGIGFLVSGDLAGVLSWRVGFWWLAVPGLILAWSIRRYLPEPARGGQSRLRPGDTDIHSAAEVEGRSPVPGEPARDANAGTTAADSQEGSAVEQEIEEEGIAPRRRLVLRGDPTRRSLWWAIHYVLAIPTNRLLILCSALGYFFLQGLETFAVVFLRGRFDLAQSTASTLLVALGIGAIAGVLVAGRVADSLIRRRHIAARPVVAGAAFLAATAMFVPALLIPTLFVAAPLFFLAAAGLGAVNPPLDAARLDVMHSRLWGRAESVRTSLRTGLQAIAPLLFGYVSTQFGGTGSNLGRPTGPEPRGAAGLDHTLLIMLAPLFLAGLLLLARAHQSYPRDVATAIASQRATDTPSAAEQR